MFLENREKMAMKMVLEFMKIASGRLGGKDKKETVDEIWNSDFYLGITNNIVFDWKMRCFSQKAVDCLKLVISMIQFCQSKNIEF